jgi:predicted acyltransferase
MNKEEERLLSLDVFRGVTIAGMLLVNNPGSWEYVYPPLKHAEWHGCTPTDLIFPFFLFIVGVAIKLSFDRRLQEHKVSKKNLILHIIKRSIILFLLGLILNGFPNYNLREIRIPGVLQRIAVCYLLASLITLYADVRTIIVVTIFLLVLYWDLMILVPVPGIGAGVLEKGRNLASYLDSILLKGHMWKGTKTWDPEGVLSTMPALCTTLIGVITGYWLKSKREPLQKVIMMFIFGNLGVVLGWIWSIWFPLNKYIWTSSYVIFTAGAALHFLAMCYWLVEIKGYRKGVITPFVIYGKNAITVFFLTGLFGRILINVKVGSEKLVLKEVIYKSIYLPLFGTYNGSLAYAVSFLLLWLGIMSIFYYKKIFIKI